MKTIIAGSRHINDFALVEKAIANCGWKITEVVSGCAKGVDTLGELWARNNDINIKQFPAAWEKHGRAAGPIRNKQMAEYAEALVAIMAPNSRGTANMVAQATKKGLKVFVLNIE